MNEPSTGVQFINPRQLAEPTGYTHVVTASPGLMVFIAGQVALDQAGELVGLGDMRAQAEQVFRNLQLALEAVGTDFPQVVKLTYYMCDISQIAAVREVRVRFINADRLPASTAVEVSRLVRPEFSIEIDAIAVVPQAK
jgi:enamine deaminase RidA (YjgF/YER057c/UK114 family)